MPESRFLARLGSRIKDLRLKKNMTQTELALLCNFEKASMSRIEAGKTNISILTLYKICKALEIDMAELCKF